MLLARFTKAILLLVLVTQHQLLAGAQEPRSRGVLGINPSISKTTTASTKATVLKDLIEERGTPGRLMRPAASGVAASSTSAGGSDHLTSGDCLQATAEAAACLVSPNGLYALCVETGEYSLVLTQRAVTQPTCGVLACCPTHEALLFRAGAARNKVACCPWGSTIGCSLLLALLLAMSPQPATTLLTSCISQHAQQTAPPTHTRTRHVHPAVAHAFGAACLFVGPHRWTGGAVLVQLHW